MSRTLSNQVVGQNNNNHLSEVKEFLQLPLEENLKIIQELKQNIKEAEKSIAFYTSDLISFNHIKVMCEIAIERQLEKNQYKQYSENCQKVAV